MSSPVRVLPMERPPLPRYRALIDKTVNVGGGQMTRVSAGQILSPDSYPEEVMRGIVLQLGTHNVRVLRPGE